MKKLSFLFLLAILGSFTMNAQTKYDTIINQVSTNAVTIDGQADEECWTNAPWINIDQVWIPFGTTVPASDFEGRFKVSWDADYLYMLVEVKDDSLSDDHANPLQNWWDDDCLEIFIDEDRSMGNHERNNNAFAYHVSLSYDAIDLNSSGGGINYKDHINVVMDTIGEDLYLWELAFRIYDESYNHSNPEASRIMLSHNKLMGLSVAYCDNDETTARENFIGSMIMPQANYNDSYKNADFFGVMKLIDSTQVALFEKDMQNSLRIYPNPASGILTVDCAESAMHQVSLTSLNGSLIQKIEFHGFSTDMNLENVEHGIYLIKVSGPSGVFTRKLVIGN